MRDAPVGAAQLRGECARDARHVLRYRRVVQVHAWAGGQQRLAHGDERAEEALEELHGARVPPGRDDGCDLATACMGVQRPVVRGQRTAFELGAFDDRYALLQDPFGDAAHVQGRHADERSVDIVQLADVPRDRNAGKGPGQGGWRCLPSHAGMP